MAMMKLSEAIKEGAKLHPQGFGKFVQADPAVDDFATCALGAAFEAVAGRLPEGDNVTNSLETALGIDCFQQMVVPGEERRLDLFETVIHLNDVKLWTREQIADWLAEQGL